VGLRREDILVLRVGAFGGGSVSPPPLLCCAVGRSLCSLASAGRDGAAAPWAAGREATRSVISRWASSPGGHGAGCSTLQVPVMGWPLEGTV